MKTTFLSLLVVIIGGVSAATEKDYSKNEGCFLSQSFYFDPEALYRIAGFQVRGCFVFDPDKAATLGIVDNGYLTDEGATASGVSIVEDVRAVLECWIEQFTQEEPFLEGDEKVMLLPHAAYDYLAYWIRHNEAGLWDTGVIQDMLRNEHESRAGHPRRVSFDAFSDTCFEFTRICHSLLETGRLPDAYNRPPSGGDVSFS